jgi:hypothetical protein
VPFPPLSISAPAAKRQKLDAAATAAAAAEREATVSKEVEAHYLLVAPIFNVTLHRFHVWCNGTALDGEDTWSKDIVGHPHYVAKKV